jgi:16S rRNA (guanine527-N7)-methyltransferase
VKLDVSPESLRTFKKQLLFWEISLGELELEALGLYASELATYEKANVVGTRDIESLWLEQILDSLSCLLCASLSEASSLADIGSGGGMPGIPLHLVQRFQSTCLVEATGKKADFLRHVSGRLGLDGLAVANYRAEDLARKSGYRGYFEAVTVRAVAPLDVISEYCLPFLVPGGFMIAMKGQVDNDELKAGERAAKMLGGELEAVIRVPFIQEIEQKERHLIVLRKVGPTPDFYPRGVGIPRKSPLGTEV